MFRFFRRLRQELLIKGRFRKYTQYAIGEIFLVVVGILIALQVNTWNEERKNTAQLKVALKTLITEIELNKTYLDEQIDQINQELSEVERFMNEVNVPDQAMVSDSLLNELISDVASLSFTPLRRNAYGNLISSGITNYDKNDSLKLYLTGIERTYQIFARNRSNVNGLWEETIRPYYLKNANVITFIDTLYQKPTAKTYYPEKREAFINNREFNNILTARTFSLKNAKANFKVINRRLGEAKEYVESYLERN